MNLLIVREVCFDKMIRFIKERGIVVVHLSTLNGSVILNNYCAALEQGWNKVFVRRKSRA